MGLFNKFLKGLGFEEEDTPKKQETPKEKKTKNRNITASFNLNTIDEKQEKREAVETKVEKESESQNNFGDFEIINVKSQVEVQGVVDKLKAGERVLINLSAMDSKDVIRSLDFLTGAVYALGQKIQKIEGSVYIIQ